MTAPVLQSPFRWAHERFARGGSWSEFGFAVLVLVVLMALLVVVHRIQQRRASDSLENDPAKLFRVMLRRLGLGVLQRDLLRRMARDLELEHPTTLLLSPTIFRRHALRWSRQFERPTGGALSPDLRELDSLCRTLFDQPMR